MSGNENRLLIFRTREIHKNGLKPQMVFVPHWLLEWQVAIGYESHTLSSVNSVCVTLARAWVQERTIGRTLASDATNVLTLKYFSQSATTASMNARP